MLNNYLKFLIERYRFERDGNAYTFHVEGVKISINNNKFEVHGLKNFDHSRIFNLKSEENWSVLILLFKLFEIGYKVSEIYLEKTWKLGHNEKGSLDVMIHKNGKPFHLIEVKTKKELLKYTKISEEPSQLFTYIWQEQSSKFASYYTFDINSETDEFYTITDLDRIMKMSSSMTELYDRWNKFWDRSGFLLSNLPFNSELRPINSEDLISPSKDETKNIFHQFLTILRTYSVSDKSNAFDKMINLFIAKVVDERKSDQTYSINSKTIRGMKFQFISEKDDEISVLKRLNDLYKDGMKQFLGKEIIDYNDDEIEELLKGSDEQIVKAFEDLRLKKNAAFSFIEVFDDKTFRENAHIVIDVIKLLQSIKFSGNSKSQFLGDFFEELLATSWKQEAGQFFTPMPMVDFIINSLPIKETIMSNISNNEEHILPKAIDYACGSGHFLIAYMHKVQKIINEFDILEIPKRYSNIIKGWRLNPYSWAGEAIFGIEKDYRLVKTTKIATFLNGDGTANIIHGDGINKFDSDEYSGTKLHSTSKVNEIFDFVIANPPYAVKGFENNLSKNNVNASDFSLLSSAKSGMIEILFIERTFQLLKRGGNAAIILPRSILSTDKYESTREFIFNNFKIMSIFESGEASFGGTSTSPVILFLKKEKNTKLDYNFMAISSPRFRFGSTEDEKKWLGYKFSSNKHKLGIEVLPNENLSKHISSYLNDFYNHETEDKVFDDGISIKSIESVIIPNEKTKNSIYLNFENVKGTTLSEFVDEIKPKDIVSEEAKYLEISNLIDNKIVGKFKKKNSSFTAKRGDILFPMLTGEPKKFSKKIVISDGDYKVSSAIAVLRVSDAKKRDRLFEYLLNNEDNILERMYFISDGFKATYLKISSDMLGNKIKVKI